MAKNAIFFYLKLQRMDISYSFRFFREYIMDVDGFIKQQQQDLDKRYDKMVQEAGDEADRVYDFMEDDIIQHFKINPGLLYNSAVTTIYSYFETKLRDFCLSIDKYLTPAIRYKKPFKDIIRKNKEFLEPYCSFTSLQKEWEGIRKYQRLRNRIVHDNVYLTDKEAEDPDSQLIDLLTLPNLEIDKKENRLKISDNALLLDYCNIAETFLLETLKQLQQLPRAA